MCDRGAALPRALAFFFVLVASFAAAGADESAPVQKPQVKEGDRWQYRNTDYPTNLPRVRTYDVRVSFVGPDEILTVNRDASSDSVWTSEWNARSLGGQVFDKPTGIFRFPLSVGATHEASYSIVARRGSAARTKYDGKVTVVGWEDIEVPAGRFRALRIELKGNYSRLDISARGWLRITFWYVPELKRWARYSYEDGYQNPSNPNWREDHVLLEFKVQE
jgi:hypothetical protein